MRVVLRLPVIACITLVLISCTDEPAIVPPVTDCTGTGTVHDGTVNTVTWRAVASPHFISDTVHVTGLLTIEAGAMICAHPDAVLLIAGTDIDHAELRAIGTAERPITFRPVQPDNSWGGFDTGISGPGGRVLLGFVQVANAAQLNAYFFGEANIEDSQFENTTILVSGSLRRSVVDSGQVSIWRGVFEDNLLRAGTLVLAHHPGVSGNIEIIGGRIENSPESALRVDMRYGTAPAVITTDPLRIIGSRGNPVDVPSVTFQALWPTRAAQDSLLGNVNDTLIIRSYLPRPPRINLRGDLSWQLRAASGFPSNFYADTLTLEPGADVTIDALELQVTGSMTALGTPESPIRISSRYVGGSAIVLVGSAQQDFANVILTNVQIIRR